MKAGTTVFPGSRTWRHESGNSERSVEQMIKLGVAQIKTKEWRWGEERSCAEQLFFGDRFHTLVLPTSSPLGRKSTLAPLNAQDVGRRSFGNTDLSDFVSICLLVPLRISMKKMSSF